MDKKKNEATAKLEGKTFVAEKSKDYHIKTPTKAQWVDNQSLMSNTIDFDGSRATNESSVLKSLRRKKSVRVKPRLAKKLVKFHHLNILESDKQIELRERTNKKLQSIMNKCKESIDGITREQVKVSNLMQKT